jgi:hypothetical protein
VAKKGSEFNNAAPAVGADAGGRNVVVSLTPSGRAYIMKNGDGSRYTAVRSSTGVVLADWSSGDNGAALLALTTAWETAGII